MSKILGTNISAPIVPNDSDDVFPSHEAKYGKGGYRTVATIAERDAIPADRRENLMLVAVEADGKIYQLIDGAFEEFEAGASIDDTSTGSTGSTWSSSKIKSSILGFNYANGTGNASFVQLNGSGVYLPQPVVGKIGLTNGSKNVTALYGLNPLVHFSGSTVLYFFNEDKSRAYSIDLSNKTATGVTFNYYDTFRKTNSNIGWNFANQTSLGSTYNGFQGPTGEYEYILQSLLDFSGVNNIASNTHSVALGLGSQATGFVSYAEGYNVKSTNNYSHGEGYETNATGGVSHAEGFKTTASGGYSHSEGRETKASGYTSHAEGYYTTASGQSSHAEGQDTLAYGDYSHTQGIYTKASGISSHAGGKGAFPNYLTAGGVASFNHSEVTNITGITGAAAANSAILGGVNHSILSGATKSVILGGSGITATEANTVYVPNLKVQGTITDFNGNAIGGGTGSTIDDNVIGTTTTFSSQFIVDNVITPLNEQIAVLSEADYNQITQISQLENQFAELQGAVNNNTLGLTDAAFRSLNNTFSGLNTFNSGLTINGNLNIGSLSGTTERVLTVLSNGNVVATTNKLNIYLDNIGASTKTLAQLNADYPAAEIGQCVLANTVKYEKTGASTWISYTINQVV